MDMSRVEDILKYFLGEADTLPHPLSRVEELLIALGELISSGAVSSPIKIKGRVDTVADLPSNAEPGWMYYVGLPNASEFAEYVYLDSGEWQYTGTSNYAIDTALSTTSTNPVENRVITEAINLINQTLSNKVDKVAGKGLSTEDFTTEEKAKLSSIETGANANVQVDWNQTDNSADDFIKNKPTIPDPVIVDQTYNAFSANAQSGTAVAGALDDKVDKVAGKGLSTEDFTTAEKAKLYNIESGAQTNVQADWNQTDTSADDFIKNKPDITFVQVNADWNATSGVAQILNKPNIPEGVIVDLVYDPTSEHAQAGVAVAEAITNKVDKVNGKGLSTNDFTDNDKTKLDNIETGAEANVQSDWNQNDSTADDFIKNKPTITTANDAVLEIQKNGAKIGEFTANASTDAVVNITVPVNAVDVNALPASTKYGASLSLSIDNTTYVITAALNDQDGNTLGMAQTIDLPLESVVVNGSYDDTTHKIILTLNNGNTVEFSVADLVSGLQTEITTTNKLDADLVDDSTSTNKFVTAADKTAWNAKSDFSGSYNDLTDKPTIPAAVTVDQTYDSTSTNPQSGTAVAQAIAKKPGEITTGKQYTIDGQTVTAGTGAEAFNNLTYNKASGQYSHAENTRTTASGYGSHAEGGGTTASGDNSHAEGGGTTASGYGSHAEGGGTTASGVASHAEGLGTKASSEGQHVQGKYNFEDTNDTYAFIIGNGMSDIARHNAFAIDWNGLIYVNGAATGVDVSQLTPATVDQTYDATSTNAQAGVAVAEAIADKVDKVTGKGLSTEDFTTAEKTKLSAIESGAQANVQSDWNQNDSTADDFIKNKPTIPSAQVNSDWEAASGVAQILNKPTLATVATSGSYDDLSDKPTIPAAQVNSDWDAVSGVAQILNKPTLATVATSGSYNDLSNKPTIPTVNDATLEIQKNGTKVGEFSSDASSDVTVNITVPVNASDVNALPDTTKYASSIDVSINNTTYVMTTTLKDQDGNTLGTAQVVDLPLETMVVGGSYDDTTHKIILTLNNGTTVDFSVADLVSGLQTEITSTNKLDADLVDDTTSAHKFVTAADKAAWNAKSDFSGSYNDLTDKPTIPAAQVNADWNAVSGVAQILNKPIIPAPVTVDQTYDGTSANPQSGVAINSVISNILTQPNLYVDDSGYIAVDYGNEN